MKYLEARFMILFCSLLCVAIQFVVIVRKNRRVRQLESIRYELLQHSFSPINDELTKVTYKLRTFVVVDDKALTHGVVLTFDEIQEVAGGIVIDHVQLGETLGFEEISGALPMIPHVPDIERINEGKQIKKAAIKTKNEPDAQNLNE